MINIASTILTMPEEQIRQIALAAAKMENPNFDELSEIEKQQLIELEIKKIRMRSVLCP